MLLNEGIIERRVHVRQYFCIGLILIMPSFDGSNPCKGTMCEKIYIFAPNGHDFNKFIVEMHKHE
jgi:hypothetical protein